MATEDAIREAARRVIGLMHESDLGLSFAEWIVILRIVADDSEE